MATQQQQQHLTRAMCNSAVGLCRVCGSCFPEMPATTVCACRNEKYLEKSCKKKGTQFSTVLLETPTARQLVKKLLAIYGT
jgi:hypothetical protein